MPYALHYLLGFAAASAFGVEAAAQRYTRSEADKAALREILAELEAIRALL